VVAEAGLSLLLLEKRQEIGSPVRCAEGVGHDALIAFIEPDPLWIAAEVDKAEITIIDDETRTLRADADVATSWSGVSSTGSWLSGRPKLAPRCRSRSL
jgi:flavin-dependent dehydrogenase